MKFLQPIILALGIVMAGTACAQNYPSRPIRLIVPFGVGVTDFAARQIAKGMGDVLGQTIVTENRASAGGIIGAQAAASAPADGYTLFAGTVGTQIVNPLLRKKLAYDPDKQFVPVGLVSRIPSVLAVRADLPPKTLDEFIAYAKAQGSKMTYGAAGTLHLGIETLRATHNLATRKIPFKSSSEVAIAVSGGQIDMMMDTAATLAPHIAAGRMRAIAVMGDARLKSIPDVPSIKELNQPNLQASNWLALYVPAGTPQPIIEKLGNALRESLKSKELQHRLEAFDGLVFEGTREEYSAFMKNDREKVKRIIAFAGLEPQ